MTGNSKKQSHSLPVLPQVQIRTPCPMKWDEMEGDSSKRFCGHCQKHVHDFSEMDADSVSQLLGSGQNICAKIRKRTDGSIVTKQPVLSCENGLSRRGWLARLGALAASAVVVLILGGCREPELIETTGVVAPPPDAQTPELLGDVEMTGGIGGAELGDVVVVEAQPAAPVHNDGKDILGKVGPVEPKTR
jgi:hypothetical protein